MAAIKHKLSARPSSGTPSAFSTRAGVVLLKTFASIRPLRISAPSIRVARYQGKKLASMAPHGVTPMARTYLIFGDIEGKLDVLRVECTKCGAQEPL
jgi:hypothetical protein